MQFRLLGPLEVHGDDGVVRIGSRVQRRLLAVLLVEARSVVSADRLVDLVWGSRPPADARQSLWTCVARLRRALAEPAGPAAEELLVTRPPGYLLAAGPDQIDADQFVQLASAASGIAADRPDAAAELLDRALGLWRGPALQEFADEPFAEVEAARLDELRVAATEDRFELDLIRGGSSALVAPLGAFTSAHPLRERPRSQLMLALHRSGRQAEALECYRDYRELLDRELGLEPSVQLRSLQTQVLQQAPGLDWRPPAQGPIVGAAHDSAGISGAPGSGLPAELTSFVGRAADIDTALAALAEARLVTLTGVGGVGKSRLALRVAALASSRFADGVSWCELAVVQDPAVVATALATALGVQREADATMVESVVAFLSGKQALLVLDNCEHLVGAVRSLVVDLLHGCPGLVILATSRERLAIDGERVRPVSPFPLPESAHRADPTNPAVSLFVDRARAVRPDLELDPDNLARIVDVCRHLDGLPLAIELAAARVRSLNPADLSERSWTRLDLLSSPGQRGGRHDSLRAVLDWSFGLLATEQQRLFCRLSVFAGTFDLAAAEVVCSGPDAGRHEVVDLLASLVDASMVSIGTTEGTVRYALLETLRHYAAEHLDAAEADALRRSHAHHYSLVAGRADAELRGVEEARWVAVVDAEMGNFRAAQRWLVGEPEPDAALRLSRGLRYCMLFRFRDEVVAWGEACLALPGAEQHPLFAEVCGAVGEGLTARGEMEPALAVASRGLAGLTEEDDVRRMYALRVAGMVALYVGRLDDAVREHVEMLRLARLHDQAYEEAMALLGLAQACTYAGDPVRGLAFAEEQLRVAARLRNPSMLALAWYDQAEALSAVAPARALEPYQRAVHLAESAGSSFVEGIAMVGLASFLGRSDDPQVALPAFRSIIVRWREMHVWHHQWTTLRNLMQLFVRIENWEPAAILFGAIDSGTTAVAAFGNDAVQMDVAAERLEEVLGTPRWRAARGRGAALSREEAVAFACEAIDAARASVGGR
jgi:predicted ATPase/DNA-binding SARP family transcriptional activator